MAGELRFFEMQQEFHSVRRKRKETHYKAAKYQEDLKKADETIKHRKVRIYDTERERNHVHALLNRAREYLAKAYEVVRELDRVCSAAIQAQKNAKASLKRWWKGSRSLWLKLVRRLSRSIGPSLRRPMTI